MSGAKEITLEDIERVHRLLSTKYAMTILDGLAHGREPRAVVPRNAKPQKITDALAVLAEWELINVDSEVGAPTEGRAVTLTPKGARFAKVRDDLSHDRDPE
jgi:DNA-binding HxlR family transcriptional regulator